MWTDNYQKAVTFSYDDGVVQDRRLVELLNRYHLKATFNINTQLQPAKDTFWIENTHVDHLSIDEMISLYRGHEVASHSQTHPDLTKLTDQALIEEIRGMPIPFNCVLTNNPLGLSTFWNVQ
jgi:peptidoglycan/xylan/chitin deacetylase (PgdA/CDA1 family)